MREIVQVIRLHMSREGASSSALFVSDQEEDLKPIIERANAMGITAEIDVDGAPLASCAEIIEWLNQFDRERTPEPAIERPEYEQRLDELTRAQRNTDRKLDQIMALLIQRGPVIHATEAGGVREAIIVSKERPDLVEAGRKFGVPDDAVPPAAFASGHEPSAWTDRNGRGYAIERGEPTQNAATRAMTSQITGTGGVLPGNMQLQGESASSEVWGIGPDGAPAKSALPKVGDSLKPLHLRNS